MPEFNTTLVIAILGITAVMAYGLSTKKTDLSGALTGGCIAIILFVTIEWVGISMFLTFFLLGSFASKWKYNKKVRSGLAQEDKGRRTAVHAYSNASAAALYSIFVFFSYHDIAVIMVAGVFATALSDTLSSEIGNVTGSVYYNIRTLHKDTEGKDGVISPEGTLVGAAGSFLIAFNYLIFAHNVMGLFIIGISGFFGNLLDSILGASLQTSGKLNNHQVNLIATASGGLLSGLIYWMLV